MEIAKLNMSNSITQTKISELPSLNTPELEIKKRNLPHWTYDGSYYFVTFRTLNKNVLKNVELQILYDHILSGNDKFYHLVVFVLMPDHVHLIFRLNDGYELSKVMKGIKGVSAKKINRSSNSIGNIWQAESFDRIIRNKDELNEKVNYIINNPINQELCSKSEEYKFLFISDKFDYYDETK